MTGMQIARKIQKRVAEANGVSLDQVVVKNKLQSYEHGYLPGAQATVVYEGGDASGTSPMAIADAMWRELDGTGFYVEPWASYLVGVFKTGSGR